jgi:hypothetical protein
MPIQLKRSPIRPSLGAAARASVAGLAGIVGPPAEEGRTLAAASSSGLGGFDSFRFLRHSLTFRLVGCFAAMDTLAHSAFVHASFAALGLSGGPASRPFAAPGFAVRSARFIRAATKACRLAARFIFKGRQ